MKFEKKLVGSDDDDDDDDDDDGQPPLGSTELGLMSIRY